MPNLDFQYKDETYKIIGACMEVHNYLGHGFLESVYHEALKIEFEEQSIPFETEKEFEIEYKGLLLNQFYRADFVVFGKIILEIKSCEDFHPSHTAQILNYLKCSGLKIGLLVNFGKDRLQHKRFIL